MIRQRTAGQCVFHRISVSALGCCTLVCCLVSACEVSTGSLSDSESDLSEARTALQTDTSIDSNSEILSQDPSDVTLDSMSENSTAESEGSVSQVSDEPTSLECTDSEEHNGEATYYNAYGIVNCSFEVTEANRAIAAMNVADYDGAAVCGACVQVTGPKGTTIVSIVDSCPGCSAGDIDLSEEVFPEIADVSDGRVAITWHYVSCPTQGDLAYHWKEGSHQWWSAVQIRNHRNAVTNLEIKREGEAGFSELPRGDDNYFINSVGGIGPFEFRVTDIYGNVVMDTDIPLLDDMPAEGEQQFPVCD